MYLKTESVEGHVQVLREVAHQNHGYHRYAGL